MRRASSQGIELTLDERNLCEFYDRSLAEHRRDELRVLYGVAQRLQTHRLVTAVGLRESFLRCGDYLGKNRTTLLRYAFVAQRFKEGEFLAMANLQDARGYPLAFWDFVEMAELSKEARKVEASRRLELRSERLTSCSSAELECAERATGTE